MIREPYGIFPYNTTIDTSIDETFHFFFSGDELESFQYKVYENNGNGKSLFESEIIDKPYIFNDEQVDFNIRNNLNNFTGKNLLWTLRLWENNAFRKMNSTKLISRSTIETAPAEIYLQDESENFKNLDFSKKENIVNIVIRSEYRRIIAYDEVSKKATINEPFSFLPQKRTEYTDQYNLYTNFDYINHKQDLNTMATLYNLEGSVLSIEGSNKIETGVIPFLNGITDDSLQENVVTIKFDDDNIGRIKKYYKEEILYDFDQEELGEGNQDITYTVTKTVYTYYQSTEPSEPKITTIPKVPYADLEKYKDTITAFCELFQNLEEVPNAGDSFSIFRNYYDSNFYFFKSRKSAILTIDNFPTEQAGAFPSRYYRFIGNYYQKNNIPIKYNYWEVYDTTQENPIYVSEKKFNSNLIFEYDNFENNKSYKINLIVENQEGAKINCLSPQLLIKYNELDLKLSGEAIYNKDEYGVDILFPDNRLSTPVLVSGEEGYFNYFFHPENQLKTNLKLQLGTKYRYDNISGGDIVLDSNNFLLSTFIGIDDNNLPSWSGEIINLTSENFKNRVALIKNKHSLQIVCSNNTSEGTIYYDFFKAQKISEGSFIIDETKKFSLLEVLSGQQQGILEGGKYRPLKDEEKLGKSFEWLEYENNNNKIFWQDDYFWTETSSNSNVLVYKLFIYPDRAELYPMLRWKGTVNSAENLILNVGYNNLTENFKDLIIEIGSETKNITNYNPKTGEITVDSSFSENITGKTFLIHSDNAKNINLTNFYVCYFKKNNGQSFNQIYINGNCDYNYLTVFTTKTFEESEINKILSYNYIPEWTNEEQNKILLNCLFDNSLNSKYFEGIETEINSYRIYRNLYRFENDIKPFKSELIADVPVEELKIFNQSFYKITDSGIRNRAKVNYSILPITSTIVGATIETNKVVTDWYEWIFTSLGKASEKHYQPINSFIFRLNLEGGEVTHNTNKVFHTNLSKYPKYSTGQTNYITTTLTCLISDFKNSTVYNTNYLLPAIEGVIAKDTSEKNNSKIYIQQTNIFSNVNLKISKAYLFINNQQRRITSYQEELINGEKFYYVIIEEPFKYFIPNLENPLNKNYKIFTDYLPAGFNSDIIKKESKIFFDDSIERINEWNEFTMQENPILIRDIKGNSFIGVISNSRENSDIKIDCMPTTISFDITQVDDVSNYQIYKI